MKIISLKLAFALVLFCFSTNNNAFAETCDSMAKGLSHLRTSSLKEVKNSTADLSDLDKNDSNFKSREDHLMNRGMHYIILGMCESALKDFTEIIALINSKNQMKCHHVSLFWQQLKNRAIVYSLMGEYEKSLADVNWIIDCSPERLGEYDDRAKIHLNFNKLNLALEDINKAIDKSTNSPNRFRANHYRLRGHIYRRLKELRKAKKDYIKAIELDSGNDDLREWIIAIDEKLK